jgi:hypothetical protein
LFSFNNNLEIYFKGTIASTFTNNLETYLNETGTKAYRFPTYINTILQLPIYDTLSDIKTYINNYVAIYDTENNKQYRCVDLYVVYAQISNFAPQTPYVMIIPSDDC